MVFAATLFWAIDNNISKIISHKMDIAKIVQLKSFIGGSLLLAIVVASSIKININLTHIPNIILLGAVGFAASIFLFAWVKKNWHYQDDFNLFNIIYIWCSLRHSIFA